MNPSFCRRDFLKQDLTEGELVEAWSCYVDMSTYIYVLHIHVHTHTYMNAYAVNK